ncbi:inositol polyphosphate 5-phosphatase K-like [Chelonus insularis]|uniref:inositol polyphosphate 5-phosphatase K-like n=1 Tax=Chelonus insularis TaxID=460826 RepID=UPI001588F647|nr:inositol polyphosphate 5-phosphatase K-like [Chelonus insularis]
MNAQLLRLYFVTYNVATTSPEQDPQNMLNLPWSDENSLPDFYVIGLQEVKSQPQNMILNMFFEDPWTKVYREALKEYDYVKIRTQRLQGLVLNIFCLRKHLTHLRLVEARYTKTGLGGMWGNKGAVSVRLNIYGINICIVNTHLTPHDHLLSDRIADYNTILKEHTFKVPETRHILFHDYVFWIGDLNFRLQGEDLTATIIDSLVKKNELDLLFARDQLKQVMEKGEAFSELVENLVTFPPTYKFELASQNYDLKRRPSWTDRILYKVNKDAYENITLKAEQLHYKSYPSYTQSDHKPVSGEFQIAIRSYVQDHGVEFQALTEWLIDEENSVSYTLLGDFKPSDGDWVGLFTEGFSSLDEYLVYEYVNRRKIETSTEPRPLVDRIFFNDSALRFPGMYRLIYVAQSDDIVSILGISPPFPGHRRLQSTIQNDTLS